MKREEMLRNYARILVDVGVNLEPGQGLHITIPAEGTGLARAVTEYAYRRGASAVIVRFVDECVEELTGAYAQQAQALSYVQAEYDAMTKCSKSEFAFLRLYAPSFLQVVPGKEEAQNAWSLKNGALASALRGHTMAHGWLCIGCCPTMRWARRVFPQLQPEQALDALWMSLLHITRADQEDPIAAWHTHSDRIVEKGLRMTQAAFDAIHIVGPGTDLTCGMIPSHIWGGGRFDNRHGRPCVPNIPTEELATTPDRLRTEGIVHSVRPMNVQGEIVDRFWIRFRQGKAVEWHAEQGEDALTRLITHDEGSCYLGETAIVPGDGLIGGTGLTYYCTLLDENATCHLALGAGFPMHVRDREELGRVNHSAMHADFMIGSRELQIYGVDKTGKETPVFQNGSWMI